MLIFTDDTGGWQTFPATSPRPNIVVGGVTETRILNGDPYRLNEAGDAVEFLDAAEVAANALAEAKATQRVLIDQWRKAAETTGFTHTFPDTTTGTVQVRNSDDKANVSGLVLGAQLDPQGSFTFRDGEDVSHTLNATEVAALGTAVQTFISGHYATAWGLKDQVEAATTVAAVEAITWE